MKKSLILTGLLSIGLLSSYAFAGSDSAFGAENDSISQQEQKFEKVVSIASDYLKQTGKASSANYEIQSVTAKDNIWRIEFKNDEILEIEENEGKVINQ